MDLMSAALLEPAFSPTCETPVKTHGDKMDVQDSMVAKSCLQVRHFDSGRQEIFKESTKNRQDLSQ